VRARANALFISLGDPTRRALFERLARDGECSVRALTSRAGVSQPAVSKHLAVLKSAGLVKARRAGRETYYSADAKALAPLVDWIGFYGAYWREKFERLDELVSRADERRVG
jgi:DNA-binding transcriptional ArsR family regulator